MFLVATAEQANRRAPEKICRYLSTVNVEHCEGHVRLQSEVRR